MPRCLIRSLSENSKLPGSPSSKFFAAHPELRHARAIPLCVLVENIDVFFATFCPRVGLDHDDVASLLAGNVSKQGRFGVL